MVTYFGFEIIDEKDTITDMQQYARNRWKTRQVKYSLLTKIKSENEETQKKIHETNNFAFHKTGCYMI